MDINHQQEQRIQNDFLNFTVKEFFTFLSQKLMDLIKILAVFIDLLMMIASQIILSFVNLHIRVHYKFLRRIYYEQDNILSMSDNFYHIQVQ